MNRDVAELATALERVAAVMDAEADAVRSGQADALAAAAQRKRAVLDELAPILERSRRVAGAAAPGERACLIRAARRMETAARRNAAVLEGAMEGMRRLYACLAEAAQAAASSGTYRPDGSRHCAEDGVGTIRRSA